MDILLNRLYYVSKLETGNMPLTMVPILRVPAIAFLYMLGMAEAEGENGKF